MLRRQRAQFREAFESVRVAGNFYFLDVFKARERKPFRLLGRCY